MKQKHIKISTTVFMWFSIIIFSFGQINPNIPKPKTPIPVTNPSKHINEINEHRENLGTRSRLNDAIVELSLMGSLAEHWFTERTEMLGVIDHNKIILLKEGKQIGEFNLYISEKDKGKIYSAGIPLADVVYGYDKSMSYEPILLFDQKGGYDVYEINPFDPEIGWYSNPRFQYNGQSDCLFPGIFEQIDATLIDKRLNEVYIFYKTEFIRYRYEIPYLKFSKVEGPSSIYSKFNFRIDRLESAFMKDNCFYFFAKEEYWRICKDSLENPSRTRRRPFSPKPIEGDFQIGGHKAPK